MYLSLRTTIFWNVLVLMLIAIALVSAVVIRITEREIFREAAEAGTAAFTAVCVSLSAALLQNPEVLEHPTPHAEPAAVLADCVRTGVCQRAVLVNRRGTVIAQIPAEQLGTLSDDRDLQSALAARSVVTSINTQSVAGDPYLLVTGPVMLQGSDAGALKLVIPLNKTVARARTASRLILLYTCVNGLLLLGIGYFLMSRYVAAPLKKLTRLTENIAAGDVGGLPLFLSEKNEIGKLTTALRTMTEKLIAERDTIQAHARTLAEKNAQLEQAHRELLQSEKLAAVGRLAAGIAHEIGNPIGIILGYLHMLRSSGVSQQEREEYLERMQKEIERVHSTISDLLAFSQPAAPQPAPCNLNLLIQDVCTLVKGQKDFRQITFQLDLAEEMPLVCCHENLLRQMLMNLVLNARDAMELGGTLSITTRSVPTDHGMNVTVTVTDTGVGIPEEHRGKIFDPFFTTKEHGKGTGLGLANVHRIVEIEGGTITVASTTGQGTTFTITLPALQDKK